MAHPWYCQAYVFLVSKSWGLELSFEVLFVSVVALVLSEYWKWLEKIFLFFLTNSSNEKELLSSTLQCLPNICLTMTAWYLPVECLTTISLTIMRCLPDDFQMIPLVSKKQKLWVCEAACSCMKPKIINGARDSKLFASQKWQKIR